MRIQSITVNSYRSFSQSDNTLKVNPGVTTIIGMNGSGKTNIINAIGLIDLVNGTKLQNAQLVRNRFHDSPISISVKLAPLNTEDSNIFGNEITEIVFEEPGSYSISGGVADAFQAKLEQYDAVIAALEEGSYSNSSERTEVINVGKSIRDFATFPLSLTKSRLSTLVQHTEKYITDQQKKEEISLYVKELLSTVQTIISRIPVIFKHNDVKTLKDNYGIDELRHINGRNNDISLDRKPNDILCSLLDLAQIQRDDIVSAMEKKSPALKSIVEDKTIPLLENNVMAKFRQFYKNNTENLSLKFRIEENTLYLIFSTGYAATEFSERSNGLRWYFKMFIDLMCCTNGERPIVYVLDEPGIHLHINAQDELRHLFLDRANQGSQIIYTTHSPYMIDENLGSLRSITKSEDSTFSCVHNSLYGGKLSVPHTLDTLAPVAAALGMDLKLTPGLSPEKLNVIVEGVTDQIYLNTMAKALDSKILEKTSIIPSTGAQNVKHLCSILMGWGFKFLAVFDYDKEGIRCAKDLNKELNLEYSDSFILLKDVSSDVFYNNGAIDRSDYIVIETMIDDTDRTEYGITLDGTQQQKKITAVRFSSAVQNGNDLSDATKHSFSTLFNRILSHT